MNSDFLDAHHRHWQDAEQLFSAQRWANADHLYGLAAECGLKRLMLAFGMSVSTTGSPSSNDDRVHANGVWARYETYRSAHPRGANYGLPSSNPFQNWHVSQRYAHQRHFNQGRADGHREGARRVGELINRASIVGLL
jgi:hypothetical protein